MHSSVIQARGRVSFPLFQAERHYMIPFFKGSGLPENLSHWQPTVDAMLEGVETENLIYFMADQADLKAGQYHRRPGLHVDGYWNPVMYAHGGGPAHAPQNRHRSYGGHTPYPSHSCGADDWSKADFSEPEALILASNVTASRAFIGDYEGPLGDGGDAGRVDTSDLSLLHLEKNVVYAGTVATLHESLRVPYDVKRTLVRLNCPGVVLN